MNNRSKHTTDQIRHSKLAWYEHILGETALPHRFPSSVSNLKPVKFAVVGNTGPVPLTVGLNVAELGRTMVRGRTAKKLMKMVPRTNMTTTKMMKVALA